MGTVKTHLFRARELLRGGHSRGLSPRTRIVKAVKEYKSRETTALRATVAGFSGAKDAAQY